MSVSFNILVRLRKTADSLKEARYHLRRATNHGPGDELAAEFARLDQATAALHEQVMELVEPTNVPASPAKPDQGQD